MQCESSELCPIWGKMRTAAQEKATAPKRQWGKVNIYEILVKGGFDAMSGAKAKTAPSCGCDW